MLVLLQIFGAIFLLIIGLITCLIIYIRLYPIRLPDDHFHRGHYDNNGVADFEADMPVPPETIHLKPSARPAWLRAIFPARQAKWLQKKGFADAGTYRIEPSLSIHGAVLPDEGLAAVTYHHEMSGVWTDFIVTYESGDTLRVSNAPLIYDLKPTLASIEITLKDRSTEFLYRTLLDEKRDTATRPVFPEEFSDFFKDIYVRATVRQLSERAASEGEATSAEDHETDGGGVLPFGLLVGEDGDEYLALLHDECIDRFIQETRMSVAEWERYRDGVFIVTNTIQPAHLVDYWDEFLNFTRQQLRHFRHLIPHHSSRELFNLINRGRPKKLRAERLGSVSRPIQADIYAVEASH